MGFALRAGQQRVNNWNSWICSNWLSAVLLMETDENRRRATVHKIMRALDNFIDPYPADGGCDEGPSYWGKAGASLFDNLELFHSASNGQIDFYAEPLIQDIGRFVYRVHIDGDYYINFADAPALVYPDGVLVYRYGERIRDPQMMQHGLWLAQRQQLAERGYGANGDIRQNNFQRLLRGLFSLADLPATPVGLPQGRDVWLPVIEVMVARDSAGNADGFTLAAKGGHNAESHNHNDIGNFVVYRDGKPLLVDAGVETYTAKTFGPNRYDIWTMQSAYHSLLPTVDGVMQSPGREYAAADVSYRADDAVAELSLEMAGSSSARSQDRRLETDCPPGARRGGDVQRRLRAERASRRSDCLPRHPLRRGHQPAGACKTERAGHPRRARLRGWTGGVRPGHLHRRSGNSHPDRRAYGRRVGK